MSNNTDLDPWQVLGVSEDVGDRKLRARYVELVKQHPPDRDPETFGRLRDAYRAVSDPRWRAKRRVLGPPPLADLAELETLLRQLGRRPVGTARWLRLLHETRRS